MSELRITCLGRFQVTLAESGGVVFPTDKTRALLVYLALEGQVHQRTELAQFLWPGYSEESARNNLRQSLHQLRHLLHDAEAEPPWLLLTRHTAQINPAASIRVDVATFTQLITACKHHDHADLTTCAPCLARLRQAVDLYGGEFFAGIPVIDSDLFEEWRRILQEQLHIRVLEALAHLVHAAESAGDEEEALHLARRQLELEAWLEAAHRRIMRILARRGQRAAALIQYQRCCQILAEELQTTPDAETIALYEQIQRGRFDQASAGESTIDTPPPVQPLYDLDQMPTVRQFYGRDRELGILTDWISTQACRLGMVLGIGGIGKTALVAQTVQAVADQFAVVIWSSLLNAPPLDEILRQWLRVLTQPTGITLPKGEEAQLRLLLESLRSQRCLLVLDNAESILISKAEASAGSDAGAWRPGYEGYAHLLQILAEEYHHSCLLITSRELPHTLRHWREQRPVVQVLTLAGLEAQAGQALLQGHGLDPDDQSVQKLVDQYSGNPLALQIVSHTIADLYAGDIRAFTAEGAPIFDDIRTVLEQQVARLSSLESELLFWLAIEREPVTPVMLRANLVDKGAQRTFLEALRALQRCSLLEKVGEGFTLQNVIIEYLTDRLVENVCAELGNWTSGARTPGAPNHPVFPLPLCTAQSGRDRIGPSEPDAVDSAPNRRTDGGKVRHKAVCPTGAALATGVARCGIATPRVYRRKSAQPAALSKGGGGRL
jgi:DNA-binding SARP family transcriptional activator